MTPATTRVRPQTTPAHGLWRVLPTPRIAAGICALLVAMALVSGTGFGVSASSETVTSDVVGTLSITDPAALQASPPVCTNALAPLDTDDCTGVAFTGGNPDVLDLGTLSGTDVEAGALQWLVSTTNPAGYQVIIQNTAVAPVLKSGGDTIADMQSAPFVPASAVDDSTHFGIAAGDPVADNESAVSYTGSPWVTGLGQQGELFRGIPQAGVLIAERTTPQLNDPITLTFAVASTAGNLPPTGSYTGLVRLTATAL